MHDDRYAADMPVNVQSELCPPAGKKLKHRYTVRIRKGIARFCATSGRKLAHQLTSYRKFARQLHDNILSEAHLSADIQSELGMPSCGMLARQLTSRSEMCLSVARHPIGSWHAKWHPNHTIKCTSQLSAWHLTGS